MITDKGISINVKQEQTQTQKIHNQVEDITPMPESVEVDTSQKADEKIEEVAKTVQTSVHELLYPDDKKKKKEE